MLLDVTAEREADRRRHDVSALNQVVIAMAPVGKGTVRLVEEAIRDTRSLRFQLSPPVLHEIGLTAALEWLAEHLGERHKMNIRFTHKVAREPAAMAVRVILFQAVRELVSNAIKHADATVIAIDTRTVRDHLQVKVQDDGAGFDVGAQRGNTRNGMGLFNIQERVQLIGGAMTVKSQSGKGTRVTLIAPLEALPADNQKAPPMSIRIVLCDDHQIIREGLRSLLDKQDDMRVLGEGTNGNDAIALATTHKPDVIVMDVAMPDLNGIAATRHLREEQPGLKILALSMHSDRRFVTGMLEAGASGYLLKDCAFSELATAIRTVNARGLYNTPRLADDVLQEFTRHTQPTHKPQKIDLTPREMEILQLIAEGRSTKNIASSLHVSPKTVETHRTHIMRKLGVHNVAMLTKYAIREGVTSLEE